MNEKKWALWLDDLRNPYTSEKRSLHPIGKTFIWARDVEQAIYFVKAFGPPDYMALDHDLGLDEENTRIQNSLVYKESGMDFLKWLEQHMDGRRPPDAIVHSDNPEGKKNMEAFIRSWSRSALDEENGNYFTVFSNPGPALSKPPLEIKPKFGAQLLETEEYWLEDHDTFNTEYVNDRPPREKNRALDAARKFAAENLVRPSKSLPPEASKKKMTKDKSAGKIVVEMTKKEVFVPAFAKREMTKDEAKKIILDLLKHESLSPIAVEKSFSKEDQAVARHACVELMDSGDIGLDRELKLEPKTKYKALEVVRNRAQKEFTRGERPTPQAQHKARQAVTQFAAGKKMRAREVREALGPTGFRDGEVRSAIAWLWDRGYLNVEVDQTITILEQYEPSG